MHVDRLFLSTLAEIRRRLEANDEYDLLMVAPLLRKLFVDDFPLVDQVNRAHRQKLVFEASKPAEGGAVGEGRPHAWSTRDGLLGPPATHWKLTREQFFGIVVARVGEHRYDVREIIQYAANVMGGVHAGKARSEPETVMAELLRIFPLQVFGHSFVVGQLKSIAIIVLRALAPLEEAIRPKTAN